MNETRRCTHVLQSGEEHPVLNAPSSFFSTVRLHARINCAQLTQLFAIVLVKRAYLYNHRYSGQVIVARVYGITRRYVRKVSFSRERSKKKKKKRCLFTFSFFLSSILASRDARRPFPLGPMIEYFSLACAVYASFPRNSRISRASASEAAGRATPFAYPFVL